MFPNRVDGKNQQQCTRWSQDPPPGLATGNVDVHRISVENPGLHPLKPYLKGPATMQATDYPPLTTSVLICKSLFGMLPLPTLHTHHCHDDMHHCSYHIPYTIPSTTSIPDIDTPFGHAFACLQHYLTKSAATSR
jgi:hypothetical protein